MAMIPSNWGELLIPGLKKIYDEHKRKQPDYMAELFSVESSNKAQEFGYGIGGLGVMDEWNATNKSVSYEDIDPGYKSTFTHKKYSKGVEIERELVDDDLYGEIKRRVKGLSRVVYFTRQVHGASVFNNGFNAAFVGADGKPLFDDAHPTSKASAQTNDNKFTYDLTAENVENVRTAMMGWKDDKGNLIDIMPDTIIVPPALRKAALIIADSDKEPDTSDNNVNVWKGALKVIEVPFLSDPNAWFMADSQKMQDNLVWFDRRKPDFASETEFNTEIAKYKTVGRWSYGWYSPLFIAGCNPS